MGTADLPHLQVQHDAPCSPEEIGHCAARATLDSSRRKPAERTLPQGLGRGPRQRPLGGGDVRVPGVEVEEGRRGKPASHKCPV